MTQPQLKSTLETSPIRSYPIGGHEVAPGTRDHTIGFVEIGEEQIEHVAQAGGRVPHAMRQLQPSFLSLERSGPQTVLHLRDRVVRYDRR